METIRTILVSPSGVERFRITRALVGQTRVQLVAMAADLHEAYSTIEAARPDLVLFAQLFVERPDFGGILALLRAVDADWISLHGPGACCPRHDTPDQAWDLTAPAHAVQCLEDLLERMRQRPAKSASTEAFVARPEPTSLASLPEKIVLIGASTGGIDALLNVLAAFPAQCPPTAIVQHTGRGFSQSLVRVLDKGCAAKVVAAEDGLALEPGLVCVAAGVSGHLRLRPGERLTCSLGQDADTGEPLPSVDELFKSAVPFANRCIAVLLTGMGSDGAAGLLDLHRAGCFTIGQDEATSVVYGMPRVAQDMGAVRQQLPLSQIGTAILTLSRGGQLALRS